MGPAALIAAVAVVLWLLTGVTAGQIAIFAGYQLVYLLGPGWLLYRAISGRRGEDPLREVAIGWALGYVLEIAFFALTASLDVRNLLPLYPVVVLVLVLAVGRGGGAGNGGRRAFEVPSISGDRTPEQRRWPWAVAAVACMALVYIAVASFTQTPLPGHFGKVSMFQDLVFSLGVSGEALHHWPITDQSVSGSPLPYHTFVYMHMASIADVTGLRLPVVFFRLSIVPLIVLFVIQVSWAGSRLGGRRWAGPLAAALLLFVGELDPQPHVPYVFFNTFFFSTHTSPTFLLGLVLFVPALVLVWERVAPEEAAVERGGWVLLVLLLLGCSGAKSAILPVLLGGLALFAAWIWLRERRLDRATLLTGAVVAVVFAVSYAVLYRGGNGGLGFDPPGLVQDMRPVVLLKHHFAGKLGIDTVFWIGATVVGLLGMFLAPLAGLLWLGRRRGVELTPRRVLLLCMFVAGLVPLLVLFQVGGSEGFFAYFGYAAAALLSAEGLIAFWERWGERPRRLLSQAAVRVALFAAGIAAVTFAWYFATSIEIRRYELWFGMLFVIAAVLSWRAARAAPGPRATLLALALAGPLLYGILDTPLDATPDLVNRARADQPLYSQKNNGITRQLYNGLNWVRSHTPPKSVIAVNNYYLTDHINPAYFYYSAFSERRTFLEGWAYTVHAKDFDVFDLGYGRAKPFPERYRLNQAVFQGADRAALGILETKYGVGYLVVDKINGSASPRVAALGRRVYSNRAVDVYAVGGGG